MRASDIMTRDVATVRPDTPIPEAIQIMLDRRVSGLPVVDATGKIVGILSEGDLLRRVELGTERHRPAWITFLRGPDREAADYVRTHTLRVNDIMTPNPETVDESTPLEEVVSHMTRRKVRRLPVTSAGKLTGIVSRADLVRALSKTLTINPAGPQDDASVLHAILTEIQAQPWWNACNVLVDVKNGHVRITGVVFQESVVAALRVAAERTAGVTGVTMETEFVSQIPVGV